MEATKIVGRVLYVCPKGSADPTYGFIGTDDKKQYFFHLNDTEARAIPEWQSLVEFVPLPSEGKSERAIHVRVISTPSKP